MGGIASSTRFSGPLAPLSGSAAEQLRLNPSPFASPPLDASADGPDLEAAPDLEDDSIGEASSEMLSFAESAPKRPAPVESVPQAAILRALTQLLIQKGVFTRDELIERVHAFASSADSEPER